MGETLRPCSRRRVKDAEACIKKVIDAHDSGLIDLATTTRKAVATQLSVFVNHVTKARKRLDIKYSRSIHKATKIDQILVDPGLYEDDVADIAKRLNCDSSLVHKVKRIHRSSFETRYNNEQFRAVGWL